MIKCCWLSILLFILTQQVLAQDDPDTSLIKRKLERSRPDTNRVQLLLSMSRVYFDNSSNSITRVDTASTYAQNAIRLSRSLKYDAGLATGLVLQSNVYRKKGKAKLAQTYLDNGINMIKRKGDPVQLANAYMDVWFRYVQDAVAYKQQMDYYKMALGLLKKTPAKIPLANALYKVGNLYRYAGDNKTALTYLKDALAIYQRYNFPYIYVVYEQIGWIHVQLGDIQTGLQYDLKAASIAEKLKVKSLMVSIIYNDIGIMFSRQNIYDKALYYFKKALVVAAYNQNEDHIRNLHTNIAKTQLSTGQVREALKSLDIFKKYPPTDVNMIVKNANMSLEAYLRLKDFSKAREYYNRLAAIDTSTVSSVDIKEIILRGIINYLQSTGQFKASRPYLQSYEPYWKNTGNFAKEALGEQLTFRTDSGLGNFSSAVQHHVRFKAMSDSLLDKEKVRLFSQLSLKYETDKKDKELAASEQRISLLSKQSLLQYSVLQRERQLKNGVFVCVLLLIALFGLGYSRYQFKLNTNRALEKQQAEINSKNQTLELLLAEKDWLLKEIHHRVKNNLQIVISLLNTQSAYLDNPAALEAIRESQQRMHAISLIHQKLYESDNLATINMSVYIRDLTEYIGDSFTEENKVVMELDVDPIQLDVSQAVPLGLILNEAISNSIKYAFSDMQKGIIHISLKPLVDNLYLLSIADNGKGLPEGFDPYTAKSLGMRLMQGLSEQLDAAFKLENENGLRVMINFRKILM
jgi:two-component sensor histidine kinase